MRLQISCASGTSKLMHDFYIRGGKEENIDPEFLSPQKYLAFVAKLCKDLPQHRNYKLFDNWFIALSLLHKLTKMGILAVWTIRWNQTQNSRIRICTKTAVVL